MLTECREIGDRITLSVAVDACEVNSDTAINKQMFNPLKAIGEELYAGRINDGDLAPDTGTLSEVSNAIIDPE